MISLKCTMHPKYTKKVLAKLVTMSYNTKRRVAQATKYHLVKLNDQDLDEVHIITYLYMNGI